MNEKIYAVAMSHAGLSPHALTQLFLRFGSAKALWEAPASQVPLRFWNFKKNFDIEESWETFVKSGFTAIALNEPEYPELLKAIPDPPVVLFHHGKFMPGKEPALAIVGARAATPRGKLQAEKMAETLAQAGFIIISGLALGIDTAAHIGALNGSGKTFAVLGSGLDRIYPYQNENLARRIRGHGALLSEFPPGTPPNAWHFPQRNRIISGLCRGVIVVEAREKSGALITARMAMEQGREVFALPGAPGHENSKGANRLIQEGAKLVQEIRDVLEEFSDLPPVQTQRQAVSSFEQDVLNKLKTETNGKTIEALTGEIQAPIRDVSSTLMILETRGLVCRLPGNIYVSAGSH